MMETALSAVICAWFTAGIVSACTADDYGRACCLKRDIHEMSGLIFGAPFLLVIFGAYVFFAWPFWLWSRLRRAKAPADGAGA